MAKAIWTAAGYWNAVIGDKRTALDVVDDPGGDVSRHQVEGWILGAEQEAWEAGGQGGAVPAEWPGHRAKAVDLIVAWADEDRAERRAEQEAHETERAAAVQS